MSLEITDTYRGIINNIYIVDCVMVFQQNGLQKQNGILK